LRIFLKQYFVWRPARPFARMCQIFNIASSQDRRMLL
jgi:hypothetical protein